MRYAEQQPQNRRRWLSGCLAALLIGALTCVLVAVVALLAMQRAAGEAVVRRIAGPPVGPSAPGTTPQPGGAVADLPQAAMLPTLVAALPNGEVRVEEAQINQVLQERSTALEPFRNLVVRFVPGLMIAEFELFGQQGRMTSGLAVQDGRILAVEPHIEGIPPEFGDLRDLIGPLQDRLNEEFARQGRSIAAVRVEAGVVVVVVE